MELLEFEMDFEVVAGDNQSDFTAVFEHFFITGHVDFKAAIWEEKDEDVGITQNTYYLKGLTFFWLQVFDNEEEEISLNPRDLAKCKQEIENKLDTKIEDIYE